MADDLLCCDCLGKFRLMISRAVRHHAIATFRMIAFQAVSLHHIEETDAGLDRPLYPRNNPYDKTLKSVFDRQVKYLGRYLFYVYATNTCTTRAT